MTNVLFTPHHINASAEDLVGNHGIGRYILLPGSDGRAKQMAGFFDNLTVKPHSRGHHLYLGTLNAEGQAIEVAAIASGMGCPSMEIILHELFHLGGKRFLRVGTAGSLQPNLVKIGDLINVQAAVRDEQTTADYAPPEVPAIASFEMNLAIAQAASQLKLSEKLHFGTVHCKSSFYAREFGAGPKAKENHAYLDLLTACGVLASEMETSALFMQSQLYNHQLMQQGNGPLHRVISGAMLGILAIPPHHFVSASEEQHIVKDLIQLALESIKQLAKEDNSSLLKMVG